MSINNIAILGAGAVGASIIHQLDKHKASATHPAHVSVIAAGERAERYRNNGLKVNEKILRPDIVSEGDFDLIILATKSYHLDEALKLLNPCVGKGTLLMSLLNGIASEGILGNLYGHEKVIPAMILGIDAQREEDGIRYTNDGIIHYGPNPLVPNQEAAIAEVDAWFADAGLHHLKSEDITQTLWRKFMINVGANQASAYFKAPFKDLQTETEARKLMFAAMDEVIALSRLELGDKALGQADIEDWKDILKTLDPTGRTSMSQDATAGRKTEVDLFAGTVVSLAEKHGLAVPVNRMFLEALSN